MNGYSKVIGKSVLKQGYYFIGRTLKKIYLDYPNCLRKSHPEITPIAEEVVNSIVNLIRKVDLSCLAKNSPALKNCNWEIYLSCSIIRMVKVMAATQKMMEQTVKILDLGSYFGNFSLMFAKCGYSVDAIDSYTQYQNAFAKFIQLLNENNVKVYDFANIGYNLSGFSEAQYDMVICLGVIEHIPHTPRLLLEAIDRVLKPGGFLILDTPNLGYICNHHKLKKGQSIFPAIEDQYVTEIPFVGHHREYTISEIQWLIANLGYEEFFF
jgi:2-polyprenyl-3-methyl-5-hydroxy-6-metoxy-1,4-benzoquinol methylase